MAKSLDPRAQQLFGGPVGATLVTTLYSRAKVNDHYNHPEWKDVQAEQVWARIAADAHELGLDLKQYCLTQRMNLLGTVLRSETMDQVVRDFAATHGHIQVLTLGVGLCNRAARLADLDVDWYGTDVSEVIALRERYIPDGVHHYVADLATDAWLQPLDACLPTLIIAEGLFMYLNDDLVRGIFAKAASYCQGPLRLVADMHNAKGLKGRMISAPDLDFEYSFGIEGLDGLRQLASGWRIVDTFSVISKLTPVGGFFSSIFSHWLGSEPYLIALLERQ